MIIPNIPVTRSQIHSRPEQPKHVHCDVCGKTWKVPALEAHLVYDKAVSHGEKKHPEIDAQLNVKSGRPDPKHDWEPGDETRPMQTDPRCRVCGEDKRSPFHY